METQEMIDILLKYADRGVPYEKYKIANAIVNRLRYLQSEVDKEKWISVKERLPDERGLYQVVTHYSETSTAYFAPTDFFVESWKSRYTYWKPLSEPPKKA